MTEALCFGPPLLSLCLLAVGVEKEGLPTRWAPLLVLISPMLMLVGSKLPFVADKVVLGRPATSALDGLMGLQVILCLATGWLLGNRPVVIAGTLLGGVWLTLVVYLLTAIHLSEQFP